LRLHDGEVRAYFWCARHTVRGTSRATVSASAVRARAHT
jgi:hypothetical protein